VDDFMWNVRTTHGYIIFKNAARILVDVFNKSESEKIGQAVDFWILLNSINNDICIYDTKPLLCHCPFISDSDIR
jgi:GR25 family glycosyltransferase involved in LPS biosynthesis